jgi:uncharacterized protein YbcI
LEADHGRFEGPAPRLIAPRCPLRHGHARHRRLHGPRPDQGAHDDRREWIFVTLSETLTKGERKLATTGRSQFVRDARRAFQDAMRDEMVADVERLTGRSVIAFLSDNHIDPDVAIECFQLAPAADD